MLGPDHPALAAILNNRARFFKEQARAVRLSTKYLMSCGFVVGAQGPPPRVIIHHIYVLACSPRSRANMRKRGLSYECALPQREISRIHHHAVATALTIPADC